MYTTEIDVEKILRSTSVHKAAGIDDLSSRFLKDGSPVLSKPVSELFNLSIKLGSFPNSCKIVKLKLLFKKGSKTNPSNYRPISLLTMNFNSSNNELLYNYQLMPHAFAQ